MRFRKLRIAWSVGCGLLAVLLIVLWMRSHDYLELGWGVFASTDIAFVSKDGAITLAAAPRSRISLSQERSRLWGWEVHPSHRTFKFDGNAWHTSFPHWLPVLFASGLAGVSWIPRRYSLRTLLIATTVVAAALGLAGYVAAQ